MYLLDSGYDWDYLVEPQEKGNSFLRHARAKVLGGCSSHNSCIAFWTPREDLDEWAAMGCTGWSAEECWPLIKRLETNDAPGDHHGRSGPVQHPHGPAGRPVRRRRPRGGRPGRPADVALQRGPHGDQRRRLVPDQLGGRQHADVVVARLPAPDHRQPAQPRVRTDVWASRVRLRRPAPRDRRRVPVRPTCSRTPSRRARREVILSAGAIDTPKLLMLSGIGPGAHLQEFGDRRAGRRAGRGREPRRPRRGHRAVGRRQPMIRTSTQWWEIGLFSTSEPGPRPARPDDALRLGAVRHEHRALGLPDDRERLLPDAERLPRALARHRAPALARLPRPRPRGPALLHRPRGPRRAGDALRRQARPARSSSQPAMAEWAAARARARARRGQPTTSSSTTSTRPTTPSTTRPCTARMGPDSDPDAVVDPRLRVRGVQGLRVADGSVMPFLPAINPCITTMMIGEKCADMLIQDARSAHDVERGSWRAADRAARRPRSPTSCASTRRSTRCDRRRRRARSRRPPRSSTTRPAPRSSPRAPSPSATCAWCAAAPSSSCSTGGCWTCSASASCSGTPRCSRACRPASPRARRGRHRLLPHPGRRRPRRCWAAPRRCGSSRARCWTAGASRAAGTRVPAARRPGAPARRRARAQAARSSARRRPAIREAAQRMTDGGRECAVVDLGEVGSGSSPTATCARAWSPAGCPPTRPSRRR